MNGVTIMAEEHKHHDMDKPTTETGAVSMPHHHTMDEPVESAVVSHPEHSEHNMTKEEHAKMNHSMPVDPGMPGMICQQPNQDRVNTPVTAEHMRTTLDTSRCSGENSGSR
jgi:hypothetical protein